MVKPKIQSKTSNLHFELFKKECEAWIERFGLQEWCLRYAHENISDAEADACWDKQSMGAVISLSRDWGKYGEVTEEVLRLHALHEVLHILLAKIHAIAEDRFIVKQQIAELEEEAIRRIVAGFTKYIREEK